MENQIELTVGQTLQLFYKFGLSAIPVVNDRSELVGTFEKADAVSLGTLRFRLEEKLSSHLSRLMLPAGPAIEARLKRLLFEKSRTVPVLSRDGKLSHYWHLGQASLESELPMPYRDLLFSMVESLQRPVAIMFQEPRAGETVNVSFSRRLGVSRDNLRTWFSEIRWQTAASDSGISTLQDADDISVFLVRTPLKIRDQLYGWIIETREEYEVAADLIVAKIGGSTLRKKMGASGLRRIIHTFEQFLLKKGMACSAGDVRGLPGLLGVSRQSLRYKMKKHRLAATGTRRK